MHIYITSRLCLSLWFMALMLFMSFMTSSFAAQMRGGAARHAIAARSFLELSRALWTSSELSGIIRNSSLEFIYFLMI